MYITIQNLELFCKLIITEIRTFSFKETTLRSYEKSYLLPDYTGIKNIVIVIIVESVNFEYRDISSYDMILMKIDK